MHLKVSKKGSAAPAEKSSSKRKPGTTPRKASYKTKRSHISRPSKMRSVALAGHDKQQHKAAAGPGHAGTNQGKTIYRGVPTVMNVWHTVL
jgi:hypothetical protein